MLLSLKFGLLINWWYGKILFLGLIVIYLNLVLYFESFFEIYGLFVRFILKWKKLKFFFLSFVFINFFVKILYFFFIFLM